MNVFQIWWGFRNAAVFVLKKLQVRYTIGCMMYKPESTKYLPSRLLLIYLGSLNLLLENPIEGRVDGEEYRFKIIFLFFLRKGTSVWFIISWSSVLLVCSKNSESFCLIHLNSVWNWDTTVPKICYQLRKLYLHL